VVVDLGTGDGRSVLARAAADPDTLAVGLDASAAAMAEASRRADRRGPANALFLAAGVESLAAGPLVGVADLVTVTFPWGSLLRGVVGLDPAATAGIAAVIAPGGRIVVLASVLPEDGVEGIDTLDATWEPPIRAAWAGAGLRLLSMHPATDSDVAAAGSSWARRLRSRSSATGAGGTRPVWRLEGVDGAGRSLTR
jgi:16S rRNA (adenine(1408)-N(1))-methyltransferase